METVKIDLSKLWEAEETAKLGSILKYLDKAIEQAGDGNKVILTGASPVWLYLKIAHSLHGKAVKLYYDSPVTGEVLIFDHSC